MNQLQLTQMLPWPGKLGGARRAARHQAAAATADADEQARMLTASVLMAYYEVAYADRALGVMERTRQLLRDFLNVATTMYAVGSAGQQDVLRAQVEVARMSEEIARNNRYAATGEDLDFGKGSTEFDRNNGDPKHGPNPCIGPIGTPPYYAMAVYPSTLGSSIGLKADADGRVLDASGAPIPGLYACGNDMASIMRGTYPGPGITLGPALVFAWRAAMAVAGKN